jgi:hypothetical protein
MSEDLKKKVRCEITNVRLDTQTQTLSCDAKLHGKIKKGTPTGGVVWLIEDAQTSVKLLNVPVRELLVKVLVGWFWVRKIQDVLRLGSQAEAKKRLSEGYDWTLTTTQTATKAAPEVVGERVVAAMTEVKKLQKLIEQAEARMKELAEYEDMVARTTLR